MDIDRSIVPEPLRARLLNNEIVVWWGQPARGVLLSHRDIFLVPFSIAWGGFAIFWETMALRGKAPLPFALVGFAFVLAGLFMIFGRFLLDSWLRGHMVYALTNRRALIALAGPWPTFKYVNLDRVSEVSLSEASRGRGTIRFGPPVPAFGTFNGGFGTWIVSLDPTPQFIGIDDVRQVFATVQELSSRANPC